MKRQGAIRLVFPPQCAMCEAQVETEFSLCPTCWRDMPFISGAVCDGCGVPLPGEVTDRAELCDDCLTIARPWDHGRAALLYKDNGRRFVLSLKHGDRTDLVHSAKGWMVQAARSIITKGMVVVPVPAHWTRLLRRRYNQAALLALALANSQDLQVVPDALVRKRATPVQDGMGRDARFRNLNDAIRAHPKRSGDLNGRDILLIDDVMTSGATLAAATQACYAAGATRVSVLVLARVAKDT